MHWNGEFSSRARMGALLEPVTDPISGQPESKHGRVSMQPYRPLWQGWLICRKELKPQLPVEYWSRVPKGEVDFYYLADGNALEDPLAWCRDELGEADLWLEDKGEHSFRAAGLDGEQLSWCFFQMPYARIPSTQWLEEMFREAELSQDQRRFLLSVTGCELEDPGAIICSCYQVGSHAIEDAISQGCGSVEALGERLRCGTNCGSCIPELNEMLCKTL